MTPKTLVISGALSEKAVRHFLESPAAHDSIVVEFDTALEQARYPNVKHWFSFTSYIGDLTAALALDEKARTLLSSFLQPYPDSGDLPGDELVRRAALRARDWQVAVPRLLNDLIFADLHQRYGVSRIHVAAGSGISFSGWRRTAAEAGIPIQFFPFEHTRMSLSRRIERWQTRWRRKKTLAAQGSKLPIFQLTASNAEVLCCSERVGNLLAKEAPPQFTVNLVQTAALGEPSEAELNPWRAHYVSWWQRWQHQHLHSAPITDADAALQRFQDIVMNLGNAYVPERFARFAALRQRALQLLGKDRPRLLLSDTQTDTDDRVWSLAAAELGIPVVSFTYDHFVDSKLSFVPDHLLCDGACSSQAAIRHGYASERITQVRSHRKPTQRRRDDAEILHYLQQPRPRLLFSDSYHAAWSAQSSPRIWLTQYQQLVEAARQLPQVDIFIKFHPLRTPKQEMLAFAGMDEQELHVRKRYLRSLSAPPNLRLLAPEGDILQSMETTALLLNTTSTTGLQAFHIGMPVIFLTRQDGIDFSFPEIHRHMSVLHSTDGATLAKHIRSLLQEPELVLSQVRNQRRYLDDYYWSSAKTLGEGVLEVLQSLPAEIRSKS